MRIKVISAILAVVMVSACSKAVREDPYMPKKEIVLERSDTPILKVWDRWEEKDSHSLQVNGHEVVQNFDLERILANDPDSKVISKLNHANTWTKVGAWSGLVFVVAGVMAGIRTFSDNSATYSTSSKELLWGITTVGLTGMAIGLSNMNSCLDEARSIHNARIWSVQAKVDF